MSTFLEDIFDDRSSLIELATHEASHTIAAAKLGIPALWAQIDPVNRIGEVVLDTPWNPPTARQRMLIAQAGTAAQCRLRGLTSTWTSESGRDLEIATDLAEEFAFDRDNFSEIDELLNEIGIWNRIEGLAQALLNRQRIGIPELAGF
jgi:hypothetical protein